MSNIRAIFFDIDDTLVRKSDAYLPPALPQALRELKHNGIITAIATGRSNGIISENLRQLMRDCGIELLSTANGQLATYGNQILHDHPLPLNDIKQIITLAKQHNWGYLLHSATELSVSEINPHIMPAMYSVAPWYIRPNRHLEVPIYQMGCFIHQSQIQHAQTLLNALSLNESYHCTPWHENGCDIIPNSGSKARSLRSICEALNIDINQTMAFGDGLNDIEMLRTAGIGVAMGNASEAVKAQADYVTDRLENNGVIKALAHFQLIYNYSQ